MANNFILSSYVNLFFCIIIGQQCYSETSVKSHEFDFLIFTQHWPITVCKEWKKENQTHTCNFPRKQNWTIHGIWPTKNGTLGPSFCNNSWHFDPEKIKPIETELYNVWIDVENGRSQYSLWVHEWTKHGTCAAILKPLNSEYNYFSKGIKWMPIYDLGKALAKNNIVPSDTKVYQIEDIQKSIIESFGVNPQIECRNEKGAQYLFEIRLCFTKNLDIMDCYHDHKDVLTNCNKKLGLLYPETTAPYLSRNDIFVHLYELVMWLKWLTF